MVSLTGWLLAAACFVSHVVSAPADITPADITTSGASKPKPPSQDPWYKAPSGFEAAAPGAVLKIRRAPGNLTAMATSCAATYNILYRTTNSLYKPTWAVTTVFVPTTKAAALLSYQHFYDSVDLDASPSYATYAGVYYDVQVALTKGYFVNVPDYEGPLASFSAGVISGLATLDSVRATLNAASQIGLDRKARYAMWGYSGGALASEWAAELQGKYAPELKFAGVALGGLTPNSSSVLLSINQQWAAGLTPVGFPIIPFLARHTGWKNLTVTQPSILGISNQFPAAYNWILAHLKETGPFNKTGFLATLKMDVAESWAAYAFQDISQYFKNGFDDLFAPLPMAVINSDGIMGRHGTPRMPVFAHKAINDEISAVAETDKLIERFCQAGANILYHRNTAGFHLDEATNGHPAAEAFIDSVLKGTYAQNYKPAGCTVLTVTVSLT